MRDFLARAEKIAKNTSPTLILGEMGVGKSRSARWIHENSAKAKKEFLVVDGRAHDEDSALLSDDFQRRLSKVGTLFIVEIFSLSQRSQDRVLQIIRDEKVRVLGASSSRPEFQSLPDYRRELFDVMTALTLKVPSLHERQEDLEALVGQIVERLRTRLKLKTLELDRSALEKLSSRVLSGNVQELELILERSALETNAGVITEDHIKFEQPDLENMLPFAIPVEDGWNRLEMLHGSLEKELIIRALKKYPSASNTQIASILGTTRRILELRMKTYHIRES